MFKLWYHWFIWRLLRVRARVLVTWARWPPRPYMVKPLILLQNPKVGDLDCRMGMWARRIPNQNQKGHVTAVEGIHGVCSKNLVKLTFGTATSSHQVMWMSLKKVWVMQNIPRWIWSFSCNWLAENKKKWAGHGLKCNMFYSALNIKQCL